MREIRTSGLMSGEGKRVASAIPRLSSTLLFLQCLEWGRDNTVEDTIQFIFDNQPHRNDANERVLGAFRHLANEGIQGRPVPLGISFFSSEKFLPLQGADLLAWEYFNYAREWERTGRKPEPRMHLRRLMESSQFFMQYADRAAITRIASQSVSPELADGITTILKLST
jgi:hypothetical protein